MHEVSLHGLDMGTLVENHQRGVPREQLELMCKVLGASQKFRAFDILVLVLQLMQDRPALKHHLSIKLAFELAFELAFKALKDSCEEKSEQVLKGLPVRLSARSEAMCRPGLNRAGRQKSERSELVCFASKFFLISCYLLIAIQPRQLLEFFSSVLSLLSLLL